jgi:hypothetical protein
MHQVCAASAPQQHEYEKRGNRVLYHSADARGYARIRCAIPPPAAGALAGSG